MSALAVLTRPADEDTDDLDLVAGVRAGDDRAFEQLYLRYQPRIAAHVRGMVNDHGRAEDITQEVFMAALRRLRETDREIAFKPWIYEIAKNACIDAFRRSRGRDDVSFDARDPLGGDDVGKLAATGATPDSVVEGKVALDNLCGAFGGLSQTHHEILVLREFEGLSYQEIGARLGLSRPAVESTLFRARRRLSEEYEELVSGERCLRVQAIVDAGGPSVAGLREQRRLARHLAHCQPCRRYAGLAGVDVDAVTGRSAVGAVAARIAGLVPLPLFLRRRPSAEEAGGLLGSHNGTPVTQWTASVAGTVDPVLLAGWTKAVAAAATVAVAGVGAGAAMTERDALRGFIARVPAVVSGPSGAPVPRTPAADSLVGVGRRPARPARTGAAVVRVKPAAGLARPGVVSLGAGIGRSSRVPATVTGGVPERSGATPPTAGAAPEGGPPATRRIDDVKDKLADLTPAPAVAPTGGAGLPRDGRGTISSNRSPRRALRRLADTLRGGAGGAGATGASPGSSAPVLSRLPAVFTAPPAATGLAVEPAAPASVAPAPLSTRLADTVSEVSGVLTPTLSAAQPPS